MIKFSISEFEKMLLKKITLSMILSAGCLGASSKAMAMEIGPLAPAQRPAALGLTMRQAAYEEQKTVCKDLVRNYIQNSGTHVEDNGIALKKKAIAGFKQAAKSEPENFISYQDELQKVMDGLVQNLPSEDQDSSLLPGLAYNKYRSRMFDHYKANGLNASRGNITELGFRTEESPKGFVIYLVNNQETLNKNVYSILEYAYRANDMYEPENKTLPVVVKFDACDLSYNNIDFILKMDPLPHYANVPHMDIGIASYRDSFLQKLLRIETIQSQWIERTWPKRLVWNGKIYDFSAKYIAEAPRMAFNMESNNLLTNGHYFPFVTMQLLQDTERSGSFEPQNNNGSPIEYTGDDILTTAALYFEYRANAQNWHNYKKTEEVFSPHVETINKSGKPVIIDISFSPEIKNLDFLKQLHPLPVKILVCECENLTQQAIADFMDYAEQRKSAGEEGLTELLTTKDSFSVGKEIAYNRREFTKQESIVKGKYFKLNQLSTREDLQNEYKKAAKMLHPDKGHSDGEEFKAMHACYEKLMTHYLIFGSFEFLLMKNEL